MTTTVERSGFDAALRGVRGACEEQAAGSLTPHQDLDRTITPSPLHFERPHAGFPDIDPSAQRLLVDGLVERPLVFSMDEPVA